MFWIKHLNTLTILISYQGKKVSIVIKIYTPLVNFCNFFNREIVTASNKIVELYARAYRNSRAQSKTSSHTLHDQASTVRNGDHNSDYICFSRKRKSTSPSFIDYFRINNDEDSF